jgi:hypothetical protein
MRGVNAGTPLPPPLRNVYLSNVTTLTTKVRVDLLRALADVLRADQEYRHRHVFVSAYISSPQLHINPAAQKGPTEGFRGTSFSFAEAIESFGCRLRPEDKFWAYRRVNRGFRGHLESLFVVMDEHEREKALSSEPPAKRSGGRVQLTQNPQVYGKGGRVSTPMPGATGGPRPTPSGSGSAQTGPPSSSTPSKRKRETERESEATVRKSGSGDKRKKRRDRSVSRSSSSSSSSYDTVTETEEEETRRHRTKATKKDRHRSPSPSRSSEKKSSSKKGSSGKKK